MTQQEFRNKLILCMRQALILKNVAYFIDYGLNLGKWERLMLQFIIGIVLGGIIGFIVCAVICFGGNSDAKKWIGEINDRIWNNKHGNLFVYWDFCYFIFQPFTIRFYFIFERFQPGT